MRSSGLWTMTGSCRSFRTGAPPVPAFFDICTFDDVYAGGCVVTSLRLVLRTYSYCRGDCRSCRLATRSYVLRWRGSGQNHPPPSSSYRVGKLSRRRSLHPSKNLETQHSRSRKVPAILTLITHLLQALLAWVGSFLSLLLIGGMQQWINQYWSLPLLLATFGPAAALVFGLPSLPASQPLNCFGECY